jgi:purine-nucleoside phosphorylase
MEAGFKDRVYRAVASLREHTDAEPKIGVILGSGLSEVVDGLLPDRPAKMPYAQIAGFPQPTVAGHRGELSVSPTAAVLAGRFHYYEGLSTDDLVLPVFMLAALGCTTLIVTNAAGAVSSSLHPGDLVTIRDHINLMGFNPLIGPADAFDVPRFPDMTYAYSAPLRTLARQVDPAVRDGVYAALSGPSYETPAEIVMLERLGADLVGMSTVPEVIAARAAGLEVLGLSTVTNAAAGKSGGVLDHAEVVEVGARVRSRLAALLCGVIERLSSRR